MNLHTIRVIITREYLNKVKKKSFLLITFLVPVLFAAVTVLPALIMLFAKEEGKKIRVLDRSAVVQPYLTDNALATYTFCPADTPVDSLKAALPASGQDVLLVVMPVPDSLFNLKAESYSLKPIGEGLKGELQARIRQAVKYKRIDDYGINGLPAIVENLDPDLSLRSYTLDENGNETVSESGVFMTVSMILGMMIFLFITLFGGGVMSSVIEEKSSRVVEVLISSVRATELMFGKIIGVALVALTQFSLWILLTVALIGLAGGMMGKNVFTQENVQAMGEMAGSGSMGMHPNVSVSSAGDLVTTLGSMPWGEIILCFFVFFFFGYLLYASLFAAIGSAVENEADTQQLQIPLTIPLMLGFFISIVAFRAPDSPVVFWGSMIPFTSPIVMLARLPFGVPAWELVVSIVLLILTVLLGAWLSAKIYKVGILMFGKKGSFKDLWKWLKMK
ncbi:MAG: ABC transporter permease [Bacteroidales bacterium]|nr:ABC transporter permease [Bacteroidales bacterium]